MNETADITEIYDLLYHLGFSANTTAFFHLSYAVFLALLNPQWLNSASHRLFREAAKHYHTSSAQIYWEIRVLARRFWLQNPDLLCIIARRVIADTPSAEEFLQILVTYMHRK